MGTGTDREVAENAEQLAAFQQALFNDLRETFESLKNQDNSSRMRAQDLPPALRNMFIGITGKYLVQVYPKKDVWKRENQKEFIARCGRLYPELTGLPVQLYEYTELLKDSYEQAAKYSLAAIVLLILFPFPQRVIGDLVADAGGDWLDLAGGSHGPVPSAAESGEYHDPAAGDRHRGHKRDTYIESIRRGTDAGHSLAEHGQSGVCVRAHGDRGIWQFGVGQGSRYSQSGPGDGAGVTSCMVAALMFLPTLLNLMSEEESSDKQTTQYRQCTIDTGSGGTEVKTSSMPNIREKRR